MSLMTAEEFAECKYDLPDGGRWSELVAGSVEVLSPPEVMHGTAVLNLSKTMASSIQTAQAGYACYELGLVVCRAPDTVRAPPICYFSGGNRFAETDETITETRPAFVVEMASTKDRRDSIPQRLREYREWGVPFVWVIDIREHRLELHGPEQQVEHFSQDKTLIADLHLKTGTDPPILPGFRLAIGDLFVEPIWWTNPVIGNAKKNRQETPEEYGDSD
jgi:Uma2 family endonuclease